MRNLIITLSVVFYALALLILLAALGVQTIKSSFEDRSAATESSSKSVKNDHILSNQVAESSTAKNADKISAPLETGDSSSQINDSELLTTSGGHLFLPDQDFMNSESPQAVRNQVAGIESNLQLSCMRANAAALTIQADDISSEFVAIKSYVEAHLPESNNAAKGRTKSRRIEIGFLLVDAAPVKRGIGNVQGTIES